MGDSVSAVAIEVFGGLQVLFLCRLQKILHIEFFELDALFLSAGFPGDPPKVIVRDRFRIKSKVPGRRIP